jgi:hypothetical protein
MSRGRGATLQSKVGYVDARPLNRQLDEVLLQHAAGRYIGSLTSLATHDTRIALPLGSKSAVGRLRAGT